MIVTEKGKYILLRDIITRNAASTGTIPAGTVIEITQVDRQFKKVIGPDLADWIHWDLPVTPKDHIKRWIYTDPNFRLENVIEGALFTVNEYRKDNEGMANVYVEPLTLMAVFAAFALEDIKKLERLLELAGNIPEMADNAIKHLEKENAKLLTDIQKIEVNTDYWADRGRLLEQALRMVEWQREIEVVGSGTAIKERCAFCNSPKQDGHRKHCLIKQALAGEGGNNSENPIQAD